MCVGNRECLVSSNRLYIKRFVPFFLFAAGVSANGDERVSKTADLAFYITSLFRIIAIRSACAARPPYLRFIDMILANDS